MTVEDNKDPLAQMHFRRIGREFAMQFLFQCDLVETDDLDLALENFWEQVEESDILPMNRIYRRGREYAMTLIMGVINRLEELDDRIEALSRHWEMDRLATVDRNILRVAIYEMIHEEQVPPLVSLNEAIEIAKDYSDEKASKFINGILNNVLNSLDRPLRDKKN